MVRDSSVLFKGKRSGIVVLLDSDSDFETIRDTLKIKVIESEKFFGQAKVAISFMGKILSEDEENELLRIIADGTKLRILYSENLEEKTAPQAVKMSDSAGDTTTTDRNLEQENSLDSMINDLDGMTHFKMGSLRSGQTIRYAGSVVVVGDVNPGAEVVAEGNIIILGALKGMVHAGCSGNANRFVIAFSMQATQLRIADVITYIPPDVVKKNKTQIDPSQAYVSQGQIFIEPLSI